ncbi:hypothetical protein EXN32_21980 [Agrobacterium tumefaciens]|uniref:hypothetical protein n=1 Tax=Agrobacterium TaxID=357 RepID=UPI00115D042B|nr:MULTISPECIES: hypothetical protein [Agrobacterium]MDA5241148.1 hypothetical protein [Agrobacterium sp. MAFF310724]MDA5249561.1 hypothetical protein [Agrobacterium sp. MAFF210268]TRB12376.1 hypothetical protein EXN32_21980 [Agrobacterium tumefaciens]
MKPFLAIFVIFATISGCTYYFQNGEKNFNFSAARWIEIESPSPHYTCHARVGGGAIETMKCFPKDPNFKPVL